MKRARDPVELMAARIAFDFANRLRGQSQGTDVRLLEAAERQYQHALELFDRHGALALAGQARSYLASLQIQLALAREQQSHPEAPTGASIVSTLEARLAEDAAAGVVSPARARALRSLFRQFATVTDT